MARSNRITVVTVTDDHYIILLAALLKSIEANLDKSSCIDLWVIDDGISKTNRLKLEKSRDPTTTSVHWQKAEDIIPRDITLPSDTSSWPLNIYMRFFIPQFMPATVKKVLFMDVDMINCHDVNELWQIDLGNNTAGAVQDERVKTFDNSWGGILNYKELQMPGDTLYFNSGLLIMDLDKWRSNNITDKSIEYITKYKKFAFYPDQYGLNIALANNWLPLDPAWNHFASGDNVPCKQIHFVGRKPIYKTYSSNASYRELFYKYLSQTEWKNTKPIGESTRYLKKINNKIKKLLNR